MTDILIAALMALFLLQFVLWIAMEVSVYRTNDADLRWFAAIAIVPLIGLVVSLWYFTSRESLRSPKAER